MRTEDIADDCIMDVEWMVDSVTLPVGTYSVIFEAQGLYLKTEHLAVDVEACLG